MTYRIEAQFVGNDLETTWKNKRILFSFNVASQNFLSRTEEKPPEGIPTLT
jgi:hypothetical protein